MKKAWQSILVYCILAFAPVWAVCFFMLRGGTQGGAFVTLVFAGFMFMPAIASILTRLIFREGFTDMYLRPHFKGNIGKYLLSWLLPIALTLAGAALYFICYPSMFDLTFSLMLENGVTQAQLPGLLISNGILMFCGAFLNFIPAFGEELGWRGYLLPKLSEHMPRWAATLITGTIWGLWHAPMIAIGHNYGLGYAGYPWTGILLMTLFAIFFGVFLAWLTYKVQSAIPAALAHGSINAVASVGVLFSMAGYDPLIGPMPMGCIGGLPILAAGVCFFLLLGRGKTPEAPVEPETLAE